MTPRSALVSVVIRVRNEEAWIRPCLEAVQSQEGLNFEVVLVDNESTDKTLEIADEIGVTKVVSLNRYSPGLALNLGVEASSGEFIAFLSGHCVPVNSRWLESLVGGFENPDVDGVYGKQLPMHFTDPLDRNDLMMAFGEEPRIQSKDWFFHNANSMISRQAWERHKFDEDTSTLEDRLWARESIKRGRLICYEPEAAVYHHNGLHRSTDADRVQKHVRVIEAHAANDTLEIPGFFREENLRTYAIVPVSSSDLRLEPFQPLMSEAERALHESGVVDEVFVLSPDGRAGSPASLPLRRSKDQMDESLPITTLLERAVSRIERTQVIPDFYLYVNWDYEGRPEDLVHQLLRTASIGGFDTVFPTVRDYAHYWAVDENQNLTEIDTSFSSRGTRRPMYRALYGLGTLVRASILRSGKMSGGKIGMVTLPDEYAQLACRVDKANPELPNIDEWDSSGEFL